MQKLSYNGLIHFIANISSENTENIRYGDRTNKSFGLIDDLCIDHNGNQITSVSDAVNENLDYEGAFDFADGDDKNREYAYNGNGALTMDLNKGIDNIEYDLLGNPKKVTMTDSRSIEYVYSADGRRLRAVHKSGSLSEKTDYIGSLILKNGKRQMYRFSGGYASFEADTIAGYHYYITDYLGNNRMVVNASTDEVEQVNHYYAYGGIIGNLSSNEGLQEFKFGDKKLDRTYGLDLYDFEARQYDAIAPWFTSIDPLAEKFTWLTPYNYCAGDPVNLIDPDGRAYYDVSKDGTITMRQDEHINDKTDFLYAEGVESPIEIKDRSILKNIKYIKEVRVLNQTGTLQYTTSNDAGELLDVFKFLHDNTSIEWSIQKINNGTSILGSYLGIDYSTIPQSGAAPDFSSHGIVSYSNIVAKAHSHIDNLAPSGDYDLNTPQWTAPTQGGGDQKNYLARYFGTAGENYYKMPKHFVYYKNEAVEYNGTNGKQKYYSSYAEFKNAWLKIK